MCNACGFGCCAWDLFSGCGCDCRYSADCAIYCALCDSEGHTQENCGEWDDDYEGADDE